MKNRVFLFLILSILLTGCSVSVGDVKREDNRFISTGNAYYIDGYTWSEIVDTHTGNLYVTRNGGSSPSGLCPLYDENGEIDNINK